MESEFRLSQENWAQLQDLVAETLELPLEERESFLNQRCHGDASLRREAESLINAFTQSGNFLDALDVTGIQRLLEVPPEVPAEGEVGPYRILRLLGRGGMGVVYLAQDTRLDRRVALKFLPIHLASHAEANHRLVVEAKMAAAMDHPNIGVVHEIGETRDGQVFIAMAYYEGETLRDRIRGKRLALAEVLDLVGQIALGLRAAHLQGCVHCDIKPSNILISGGDPKSREAGLVKIVDFGIARSLDGELGRRGRDTSGTIAYMSPERTHGNAVDLRTDVWSLGVVIYEMLTGRQPFRAERVPELIELIRNEEPDPVGTLRPDIPAALEVIVSKCLRKDPAERYTDAEAFLADLEQFNASRLANRSPGNESRKRTGVSGRIAVLPLENLSPDRKDEYFALATTDELISRLSRLKGLRVIGRTSSLGYAATKKRIAEIGMELGVHAIVSGSVRKEGENLRVFLNFTESATEELLWSEVFEGKTEDAIAVQQKIATRVSEALNLQMQPGERAKIFKTGTRQREAYENYLKGRYFLDKFDEASVTVARDHFQRALDIDPTFAEAWSGLADAYKTFDYFSLLSPKEAATRAKASAERALELDPDLAEGHTSLATVLADHYWDWDKAAHHYRTAIELSPGYPTGHQVYAEYLRDVGRFDEAMIEIRKAQELDPLSPFYELIEGTILLARRRPADAIARFEQAVEKQPNYPAVHVYLALAYLHDGRYETVLGMMEMADPQEGIPDAVALRGCALARLGRIEEAHRMLDRLEELSENRYIAPYHAALIHANLNDVEKALDYLEKTAQERSWFVRIFPLAPDFDPLRSHPRFVDLLKRIGLNAVAGGL